jgi:hypothetical protein
MHTPVDRLTRVFASTCFAIGLACGNGESETGALSGVDAGSAGTAVDADDTEGERVDLGPVCGNAQIEGDEECDDHSPRCVDCQLPIPDLLWSHDLLDEAGPVVVHTMTVTPDGGVLVAGSVTLLGGFVDSWIRHYDVGGVESWTTIVDLADGVADEILAIDVAPSGAILATGNLELGVDGVPMLAEITTGGDVSRRWVDQSTGFTGPGVAIAASSSGAALVADGDVGTLHRVDGVAEIWSRDLLDSDTFQRWWATDVAFGTDERVIVVGGRPYGHITLPLVATYSATGELEWVAPFEEQGETLVDFIVEHMLVDASGAAHVFGRTPEGHADTTWYTRVSANGTADPVVTWRSDPSRNDRPNDVALDPNGAIMLAGDLALKVPAGFVVRMPEPGVVEPLSLLCPADTLCRAPEDGSQASLSIRRLQVTHDGGIVALVDEHRQAVDLTWVGKLAAI